MTASITPPAEPLPPPRITRKPRTTDPAFDIRTVLHHRTGGVDLTPIDGIAPYTALVLREIGGTTWVAQFRHSMNTMPLVGGTVQRSPAYLAGDHDPFRQDLVHNRDVRIEKHSVKHYKIIYSAETSG